MNRSLTTIHKLLPLAAALTLSVAATGCFTGVESTPKITERDVRRDAQAPAPEDSFLTDVAPRRLFEWNSATRFVVTDPRIGLAFNVRPGESGPAAGSHLNYRSTATSTDLAGRQVTDILLADSASNVYAFRIASPPDSVALTSPSIPFAIPLEVVDTVGARLVGHRLYVMTPTWRDRNGNVVRSRKFIEVDVTKVTPGNDAYPVAVEFTAADGQSGRLLMSVGPDAKRFRSFGALFSFQNPRQRYPAISDQTWQQIIDGRVSAGMTRDECRLALGAPVDVVRRPGYSYLHETWRYETGSYLVFEDGILRSFRL